MGKRSRLFAWSTLAILLGGTVLFIPALRTPFLLDDYLHASMVAGNAGLSRGPFDLYDFVNDADRGPMLARGLLPWWSHPHLTIRFFRPLSSLLRWVELRALGVSGTFVAHLHSLLWWALAVLAVRALFRRSLAPRAALFATAIYALGPWHLLPIAWLANREVLLCTAIGVPALIFYLRFRDERRTSFAFIALAGFAIAFGCGEYAFCLGGYVLADELLRKKDSLLRRAISLLPFAAPAFAFLVLRRAIGYGTFGSSILRRPALRAAEAALRRAAPPAHAARRELAHARLRRVGNAGLARDHRRHGAGDGRPRRRGAAERLRFARRADASEGRALAPRLPARAPAGVAGGAGAARARDERDRHGGDHRHPPSTLVVPRRQPVAPRRRRDHRLVATLLGFLQLVHGPLVSLLAGRQLRASCEYYAYTSSRLAVRLAEEHKGEITVLRGAAGAFFGPFAFALAGAAPVRWRVLAQSSHVLVVRVDDHTLELTAPPLEALFPKARATSSATRPRRSTPAIA